MTSRWRRPFFDENGNFVIGGEKIVEMRLLDSTLEKLGRSGINVKSSFDVKPGSYLVRLVVRDAEGELMAAKNGRRSYSVLSSLY